MRFRAISNTAKGFGMANPAAVKIECNCASHSRSLDSRLSRSLAQPPLHAMPVMPVMPSFMPSYSTLLLGQRGGGVDAQSRLLWLFSAYQCIYPSKFFLLSE
jgi:hypothetical protein